MSRKQLARRHRLIIKYSLIGLTLVTLGALSIRLLDPQPEPYQPGDTVEGITRSLDRDIPADHARVRFTDAAPEAGLDFVHFYGTRSTQLPEDMGSGAAWGDYDGDGDLDLYLCNFAAPLTATEQELRASPAGNRLYRNNGDGTFTDVSAESGTGFQGWSMGAAWADYDGDDDLDLLVTNYGTNILYRNEGGGRFRNVSQTAGLSRHHGFWAGASWSDYDGDGDLDLYVCGYVRYHFDPADRSRATLQYQAAVPFTLNPSSYPPERNLLFRNNGNGTFTEVAEKCGVDNPGGRSLSAAWCDFDQDGWPDLYVANDISDNAMFRNLGKGKFADVSHQAWVADYRGAMGLAIGDWDSDGDLDIFITHWIAQENALLNNLLYTLANPDKKAPKMLFIDIADQVGLGQIALDYIGWGTSFFDYDNDGREDLFVANGSTFQDERDPRKLIPMRNLLFQNKGEEEGFFEVGKVSGEVFAQPRVGRGAAFGDYDNDGDVDIVVVNHGARAWLLRNDGGNRHNWLKVRVRGSRQNLQGIGARVEVTAGGRIQAREIGAPSSYLSQNPFEAHFGLGRAARAERVRVTFPGGAVRERTDVSANQTVVIEERGRP